MTRWKRYTPHEIHQGLLACALSARWSEGQCGAQAMFCPYYVPLEGVLGFDWGVIVNPESTRFGQVTFEHDDCGCPADEHEDAEGWGRHGCAPYQEGDTWSTEWKRKPR